MLLHIYDLDKNKHVGTIRAKPECPDDCCDSCGDCLVCYWEDKCYGNEDGEHLWVRYIHEGETVPRNKT